MNNQQSNLLKEIEFLNKSFDFLLKRIKKEVRLTAENKKLQSNPGKEHRIEFNHQEIQNSFNLFLN
jgi:hypothetical protein